MEIVEKKKSNRLFWLLTVTMLCSIYILNTYSWGRYLFLMIALAALVVYAIQNGGKVFFPLGPYHWFTLAFSLYCLVSSIWAWVPSAAVEKCFTIIQIVVCYTCLLGYYHEDNDIEPLLSAVMWTGYIISIYAIFYYGYDTIVRTTANDNLRIGNTFNNINSIGMLAAYSCVIQIYRAIYEKVSLSMLFMIPAILIVAGTQSRKAVILLALGVLLIVMIRNFHNRKLVNAVLSAVVSLLLLAVVVWLVLRTGLFIGVEERMESLLQSYSGSGKIDIRTIMRRVGWAQFLKTPLLGIGIGSSNELLNQTIGRNTYLHCNYVELLSCGGVVGFLIYYSMYAYLIVRIVFRSGFSDRGNVICAVLILLNLIMDYGAVSYSGKLQYFFFMVYFLQERKLYYSESKLIE